MKNLITIILAIGSLNVCPAQFGDTILVAPSQLTLIDSIAVAAEKISTDPLQNYYIITANQELMKYDRSGTLLFRYSNNRYGPISWIEASDPFHVQLFFEEYQRLVILDNTLSEISSFSLQEWGYYEAAAVSISYDNNLWIYDAISGELRKIDRSGNVLFSSDNLFYQIKSIPEPLRVVESKKYVVLLEKNQGFFLFDLFGKFIQKLDLPPSPNFQLRRDLLIYEQDGALNIFNLKDKSQTLLLTNQDKSAAVKNIRFESNLVYQLEEKCLKIFEVKSNLTPEKE